MTTPIGRRTGVALGRKEPRNDTFCLGLVSVAFAPMSVSRLSGILIHLDRTLSRSLSRAMGKVSCNTKRGRATMLVGL